MRFKKKVFKILLVFLTIIIVVVIGGYIFLQQPQFGKNPTGERLERIKNSPNYRDGKFQNLTEPPSSLVEENTKFNLFGVLKEFYIDRSKNRKPASTLPSIKTDLKSLKPDENILVWFGHSSFFLQIDGKKILMDPVFSGSAAPVKFYDKSYAGSDIYTVDDMPDIDYLLISHDHYDHLDYDTVKKLKPKVKKVVTGLGIGADFEYWGYDKDTILERDWNETADLGDGFKITVTPSSHRSGRSLKANQTLWSSFVVRTPDKKIFFSGDSGYGAHFKDIGNTYGPFDLAILECGQYSKYWPQSHMMPEQVAEAAIDLKAEKLITGHWAKFSLSLHDWDEPIKRILAESKKRNIPLLYPLIGEKVDIKEIVTTEEWWEKVE